MYQTNKQINKQNHPNLPTNQENGTRRTKIERHGITGPIQTLLIISTLVARTASIASCIMYIYTRYHFPFPKMSIGSIHRLSEQYTAQLCLLFPLPHPPSLPLRPPKPSTLGLEPSIPFSGTPTLSPSSLPRSSTCCSRLRVQNPPASSSDASLPVLATPSPYGVSASAPRRTLLRGVAWALSGC